MKASKVGGVEPLNSLASMLVWFGTNRTLFRWHGMATALLRLSPPIYIMTPLGEAYAHVLIDYGIDHNSVWIAANCETGSVAHFDSSEVRFMGNEMLNLPHPKPFTGREVDVEYGDGSEADQSGKPVHGTDVEDRNAGLDHPSVAAQA